MWIWSQLNKIQLASVPDPLHFQTDPDPWITDPDLDLGSDPDPAPALFVSGFQDFTTNVFFYVYYFL